MKYWNILCENLSCLLCNGYQYNENLALTSINLCQASYCVDDYNWDCATYEDEK